MTNNSLFFILLFYHVDEQNSNCMIVNDPKKHVINIHVVCAHISTASLKIVGFSMHSVAFPLSTKTVFFSNLF